MRSVRKLTLLLLTAALPIVLFAQVPISMSDAIMKGRTTLAPANLRALQWIPNTYQFTHVVGQDLVRMDASSKKNTTDTLKLLPQFAAAINKLNGSKLEKMPALTWTGDGKGWFRQGNDTYTFELPDKINRVNGTPTGAENIDIHDKTFKAAYTKNDGLWVNIDGKEDLVAQSEGPGIVYGKSVHRDEFGITKGTFWSNSGRYLAFYRMDESMVTPYPIYVLDSMPAQVREIRYPYAGAQSHHVTIGVYDTQTGQKLYLNTGEPAEQFLTNIAWAPDDKTILTAVVNRGQNHMWLRQYDATTGAYIKTLFEETSETWTEPEKPAMFIPKNDNLFVWQSERSGFNQLYLYDMDGNFKRKLSNDKLQVTNFTGFSADGSHCVFQVADATGLNRFIYRTNIASGESKRLTSLAGIHSPLLNTSGDFVLDVFSGVEIPREVYVINVEKPGKPEKIFVAPNPLKDVAVGKTTMVTVNSPSGIPLNARIIAPSTMEEGKKYPALVYVYNGPHAQLVNNNWLGGGELWMHRMANEGFVVFVVDGRGSGNRGQAFESAIFRRCGDVEIEDQIAGLNYLKSLNYIDANRIGVYGWSYGGFMATSLMTRPESKGMFQCGVAGGAVMDWKMYEIMYTERYMDTPRENPDGYNKSSLFNYIDNLDGRLLLIHDSSDDVVLWQHTLRYIRECVKKGKQIDYFVYPEHAHNVMGPDRVHLFEKIEKFFKENLAEGKEGQP